LDQNITIKRLDLWDKDARFRKIPILILTGKAETADKMIGLRYDTDDYLPKPSTSTSCWLE